MLPVSGAWQLITSGAMSGLQPDSSANGAYWRLVSPASGREEQVPQALGPRLRLQLLDHRRDVVAVGPGGPPGGPGTRPPRAGLTAPA